MCIKGAGFISAFQESRGGFIHGFKYRLQVSNLGGIGGENPIQVMVPAGYLIEQNFRQPALINKLLRLCSDEDEHNPNFLNFGTELLLDPKILYPVICINCTG